MKRFFIRMLLAMVALTSITDVFAQSDSDIDNDYEAIIKQAVEEQSAECPMELGEGMVMRDIYIANKRMVYDLQAPADILEVFESMLTLDKDAASTFFTESILEGGDAVVFLFVFCVNANYGLEFRFSTPDSVKSINMVLSPEQLGKTISDKYNEEQLEELITNLLLENM